MKVCTDSCILGAWFAAKETFYSTALDIGSSTGLLMLMLAQKHHTILDGIEIDAAAFRQLKENICESRWADRLNVFSGDARSQLFSKKYDFIIVNPPFFEGNLVTDSDEKNLARHSKELTLEELLSVIDRTLETKGSFGILLPAQRTAYFEELALQYGFYIVEKLSVRQTPTHDFFRSIIHFSRNKENIPASLELTIKNEKGNYTEDFIRLMKEYYLYL